MVKKILAVVLSASMAIALIGCNSSNGGNATLDEGTVKLGKYKGLVVYHDDVEVTDDYYNQQVDSILQQKATTSLVKKGTVKEDSTANVDYVGKIEVDGKKVEFENGSAKDQNINVTGGASQYIEGFTAALKGHKVGDKFTEKLKFPKTYTNTTKVNGKEVKLAGKDVWFTFTINGIQETNVPELTDKFVKDNFEAFGLKTVKEFEKYLKEQMRTSNIMSKLWQKLVDSCEVVEYNKKAKESAKDEYESQFEAQLQAQYGADLKTYKEACSLSDEDWDKQLTEQVESSLKERMIVKAIAKKEGLDVNSNTYKTEAESLAKQNSVSLDELESQYGKDEVEYAIIYQRVTKFIVDNVEEKEGTEPTTTAPETTTEAASKKAEETTKAK